MSRPAFDSVSTCSKCGHKRYSGGDFDQVYRRADGTTMEDLASGRRIVAADEWIERTCPSCGYVWQEAPLDAGGNEGEALSAGCDEALSAEPRTLFDRLCRAICDNSPLRVYFVQPNGVGCGGFEAKLRGFQQTANGFEVRLDAVRPKGEAS